MSLCYLGRYFPLRRACLFSYGKNTSPVSNVSIFLFLNIKILKSEILKKTLTLDYNSKKKKKDCYIKEVKLFN